MIACAQQSGFSLEEIRRLLPDPVAKSWPHDELLAALRAKVGEIEAMQARLAQNRAQLLATIAAAIGGGGLGVFIFRGIATVDTTLLLAGAVPAAVIALSFDGGLGWIERRLSRL